MAGASDLIHLLFDHIPPGYIEVRVIEDRKGGRVIERRWYRTAEELSDAIGGLNRVAQLNSAAVFFGVLPRRSIGTGKAEDALPSSVCWVDLDFKSFPEGEPEVRRLVESFPLPPSAMVRSGHGLSPLLVPSRARGAGNSGRSVEAARLRP